MADMQHGPNIHCALVVELEGRRFLLDPGYLVAEPVPLDLSQTVQVQLPGHRLEYRPGPARDQIQLFSVTAQGQEIFRYSLRTQPVAPADFLTFWQDSFAATGMNSLHLNRLTSEGRLSAHNFNLRIESGSGKRNLKLREGYVDKVSDRFGLDPRVVNQAYTTWERQRCRNR